MGRMILVSNRLPVTIREDESGQDVARSSGGLVAGLDPLHQKGGGIWIGYPGTDPDQKTANLLSEMRLESVEIPSGEYSGYYEGYSNGAIWPLFHYLLEHCDFDPEAFDSYRRVNQRFADQILKHANEDDTIWIHDYQLMLVPSMIRDRLPGARIGFFLHIPFPSSEVLRVMPQREELLRGLLGADLIGVHTFEYADHLSRSFRRVLGLEARQGIVNLSGRKVRIEAHPLGIDTEGQRSSAFSDEAEKVLTRYKRSIGDAQVILGVDRLDYTKGLPNKLKAFKNLLDREPRWRDGAVLIQVAVPSREAIGSYRDQKSEVERLVGEINGLHGRAGKTPVQYIYGSVSPAELGALYRLADVALISPIRDGLNLVAKEYVAVRDDGAGMLVLSEFAGAATELGEALRINPWDVEGTADQIERALDMGYGERNERMSPMHRRVIENDVHRWVDRFVRSLGSPENEISATPPMVASATLAETLSGPFAAAEKPLIMLDYDGTLREFTAKHDEAEPTAEILSVVSELAALNNTDVYINTGRDRNTIGDWFKSVDVALVAEHGSWMKSPGKADWQRIGEPPDLSWQSEALPILEDYVSRTPGAQIEQKTSAIVWHYREADSEIGEFQALDLTSHLENTLAGAPVEIITGSKIVEIRQYGTDKGRAFRNVSDANGPYDFVLAIGDDRTDEDLFEAIGDEGFTVHVGPGGSSAASSLHSPASVRRLLKHLINAREQ
ncbi:MAG: bifunctional alpha,alpha-trehalose-phosphate synthase (UDP-forming)/trehalose-phosphatase [Chloroflexi bacterium]|nr:bifunctional alpha,alpha-trehalose-phosphate synthase (UDP-forming)/trehalose-phosphatase [Chloroflexota bacterium]